MIVKAANLVPVLHEDDRLVVVVKPAGVDVGGLEKQSAPGLVELVGGFRGCGASLLPVNRLSRYESGILILAKNAGTAAHFRAELKNGRIAQEYTAVVRGRMDKGRVVLGAASVDEARPPRGKRKPSPMRRPTKSPKRPAVASEDTTELIRLETGEKRSLIRCVTSVSTTHALRAQLRSTGLRLLGDPLHDRAFRPPAHYETCLHLSQVRFALSSGEKPFVFKSPPGPEFQFALHGEKNVERALHAALVRRMGLLDEAEAEAIRLLNGSVEDVPGLVVEKFGQVLVLQTHDPPEWLTPMLKDIARWFSSRLDVRSVYLKRFVKNRQGRDADLESDLRSPAPFVGKPAPPEFEIRERGLRFSIHPYDGYSVGLFLDQRENRSRVRESAAGKRVLNLFAYTCGFSVAAAAGGAEQTVSVDVAVKNLEWGKANFALNGIDLDRHLFFRSDAAEFLSRMKKQGKTFDLIILDPPSFAHGRGSKKDFSVLDDLGSLVGAATEVLTPGGVLLVSTNHRKMTPRGLIERVRRGTSQGRLEILETPPLPVDFAMDSDYAKTVIAKLSGGSRSPDAAA